MKTALGYFKHVHRVHWGIESYHRAIKQVCGAERFFVRWKGAIRNHLFCVLRAFTQLELQRWCGEIKSWYSLTLGNFDTKGQESLINALEDARLFADTAPEHGGFLFLLDTPGLGKGHLATGVLKSIGEDRFVTQYDLLAGLRNSYLTCESFRLDMEQEGTARGVPILIDLATMAALIPAVPAPSSGRITVTMTNVSLGEAIGIVAYGFQVTATVEAFGVRLQYATPEREPRPTILGLADAGAPTALPLAMPTAQTTSERFAAIRAKLIARYPQLASPGSDENVAFIRGFLDFGGTPETADAIGDLTLLYPPREE